MFRYSDIIFQASVIIAVLFALLGILGTAHDAAPYEASPKTLIKQVDWPKPPGRVLGPMKTIPDAHAVPDTEPAPLIVIAKKNVRLPLKDTVSYQSLTGSMGVLDWGKSVRGCAPD